MSGLAAAIGAALIVGNLVIYGVFRRRARSAPGYDERPSYPLSWPTRVFRYAKLPIYLATFGHLLLEGFQLEDPPSVVQLVSGTLVGALGAVLLYLSLRALGRHFSPCDQGKVPEERIVEGVYGLFRHPIYVANLLQQVAIAILLPGPIIALVIVALLLFYGFAIRDEERAFAEA